MAAEIRTLLFLATIAPLVVACDPVHTYTLEVFTAEERFAESPHGFDLVVRHTDLYVDVDDTWILGQFCGVTSPTAIVFEDQMLGDASPARLELWLVPIEPEDGCGPGSFEIRQRLEAAPEAPPTATVDFFSEPSGGCSFRGQSERRAVTLL